MDENLISLKASLEVVKKSGYVCQEITDGGDMGCLPYEWQR